MTPIGTNNAPRRLPRLRPHTGLAVLLIAALLLTATTAALASGSSARPATGVAAKKKGKSKKKPKAKKKTCAVQTLNRKTGKYQTVFVTRKVKVKRHGRTVTVTRRVAKQGTCMCPATKTSATGKKSVVYMTLTIQKTVRKKGKTVHKKVKVKVMKLVKCGSQSNNGGGSGSNSPGLPVTIALVPPSNALLDFQAFQRTAALSGTIKGFFVGGFKPNQDNQLTVSHITINIATTPIFIDDACGGQVSAAIETDPSSFAELDPASTGNTVNIDPAGKITGLVHLRIQTALLLRNDDNGCNKPYITTGWTDLTTPLFVSGKLVGLTSTINSGDTVLDNLAACLAPGPPSLPCNGFAIPFPAIFSSTLVGNATIGS